MDIIERLTIRATTYNTGYPINPEAIGTLGYYSSYDAKLDAEAADEIKRLLNLVSMYQDCDSMINQELKDVRAKALIPSA